MAITLKQSTSPKEKQSTSPKEKQSANELRAICAIAEERRKPSR